LIQIDRDPDDFLPRAIDLIKKLLKVSKKTKSKADNFVISLVNSLYYALHKENNINHNNTNAENMNEDNIWNDPYRMLRTLVRKLEELMETDNEEFKLEISESIKEGLRHGYNNVYLKKSDTDIDELTELFSGARV
jgi:KaiC/GvpD/RAD55 family RecA-like ATPase